MKRIITYPLTLLLCLQGYSNAEEDDKRIGILIRSFIPNAHPNLPNYFIKTQNNSWVLKAPNISLPGFDIGKLKDTCFKTDNRSFSNSPTASSRIDTEIIVVIKKRKMHYEFPNDRKYTQIGLTENVDCKTGQNLQPPLRENENCVKIGSVKKLTSNPFISAFNISASCANPFYKVMGVSVAPKIDYTCVVEYNWALNSLKIYGNAGYFPAFEIYTKINNGQYSSQLSWDPYKDSTANSLFDLGAGINLRNYSIITNLNK